MLKAVLFDLDHTLVDWDSAEPWEDYQPRRMARVFDFVHRNLYPLPGVDAQSFFTTYVQVLTNAWIASSQTLVAPRVAQVLTDTLVAAGLPDSRLDIDAVLDIYDWQPPAGECAYPDVVEVLPQLRAHGIELGIITNASHPMAWRDRELEAFELLHLFSHCRVSAADVGVIKPHAAIFEHALALMNIRPEEAVFVGDNLDADVRGAQGVGMFAVWRNNPSTAYPDDGVTPDGTIKTLHDLLPLLDKHYPGWRNGQTP
ncbi:MAG: HAD family hydrolase [Chloroflexi bacterium]|nr:HAD family hydrolase [Chloroflexota bacterium]